MAFESAKRDKVKRQWDDAQSRFNQYARDKSNLGSSIRNYDRIISEGDKAILELEKDKPTYLNIRDRMKVKFNKHEVMIF